MLCITDEATAIDFNRAVALRLLYFDNERQKSLAKEIARQVGREFFGGGEEKPEADVEVM